MSSVPKIAIIGAGVCGATVAFRLQEQFGNSVSITIFSEKLSPNTTGDISAGLWTPSDLTNTPVERAAKWGRDAHDFFFKLWRSKDATEAGISLVSVTRISLDTTDLEKEWEGISFECCYLDANTLEHYKKRFNYDYKCGMYYKTFTIEPSFFLPYLYKRILKAGGRIVKKRIESFDELESYNIVINCTGLGAHTLVENDIDLKPIRGQIIRVRAPWITHVFGDEASGNYIIPNMHSNTVVLGGTAQEDNYSLDVNAADRHHILEGCAKLDPSVRDAEIIEDVVGLRPGRTEVRLERDVHVTKSGERIAIIHNYGHGGSGVTLSYGCAVEVANIAGEILESQNTKSKL